MWTDLYQNITVFVCRKKYTLHVVWPVFKNLRGSTASRLPVNTVRMKESSKTSRESAAKTAASAAMVRRTCQCSLFMVHFTWSGSLLEPHLSLLAACKTLFCQELKGKWGKHCRSCSYCQSISKSLVTTPGEDTDIEFCSEACCSKYKMLLSHVSEGWCSHSAQSVCCRWRFFSFFYPWI